MQIFVFTYNQQVYYYIFCDFFPFLLFSSLLVFNISFFFFFVNWTRKRRERWRESESERSEKDTITITKKKTRLYFVRFEWTTTTTNREFTKKKIKNQNKNNQNRGEFFSFLSFYFGRPVWNPIAIEWCKIAIARFQTIDSK